MKYFVGLHFNHGEVSIKPSRLLKLRAAISGVLERRRLSGHALEVVLRHVTWALMVRREALAIIHHCYEHVSQHRESSGVLSTGCRAELWKLRALLPLLRFDVHASWHSEVMCSDASPFGIGVCSRRLPASQVGSI